MMLPAENQCSWFPLAPHDGFFPGSSASESAADGGRPRSALVVAPARGEQKNSDAAKHRSSGTTKPPEGKLGRAARYQAARVILVERVCVVDHGLEQRGLSLVDNLARDGATGEQKVCVGDGAADRSRIGAIGDIQQGGD